jgi:hypothetical protein
MISGCKIDIFEKTLAVMGRPCKLGRDKINP